MNASIGIHFVDKDGIIIYANPFDLEILGYTEDEYVGHHVSEFQLDEDILSDMLCRLTNNEPLSNYPARVQAKDKIKYLLYNSNVYHKDGEFIHTRCFASEIDRETYEIFKRHSDYFK
jgi:PAS domain S-box-containing protein